VFDRFRQEDQTSTRVHGGLGLGLSIVKHLVELHGGTASVSSGGPGQGACFSVRLPATKQALTAASRVPLPAPPADTSLIGRTILVVDDDVATRDVVSAALESVGADVCLAESAREAWDALNEGTADLLVVDLAMPVEDGLSFIRRVRTRSDGGRLPAIALSAFADARSEDSARAAGFSAFLAKPARPETLLHLIDRLLNAGELR
jgi:CheY-like chemotaxis protein